MNGRTFLERLKHHRHRHRDRHVAVRGLAVVGGFLLVLVGAALLVLPGPGIPVLVVGLFLLALEFAWAERLLERTVERAERAAAAVRRRRG